MKLAIPILGALAVASGAFAATGYTHAPSGGLEKRFTSTKPYVTTSGSTCTVTSLSFSLSHLPRSSEPLSPPCSPLCLHSLAPELPLTIK